MKMRHVSSAKRTDCQLVELIGRNRLIADLLSAGLEVAIPQRDRGIDLIAYTDLKSTSDHFNAQPIQLKAATSESFQIDRKHERLSNLLIVFACYVHDSEKYVTFAMSYLESLEIANQMGYSKTASWTAHNAYATTQPSKKLKLLLQQHEMNPQNWRELIHPAKRCIE